jgi:transglutaminase-like putative cysteine protease
MSISMSLRAVRPPEPALAAKLDNATITSALYPHDPRLSSKALGQVIFRIEYQTGYQYEQPAYDSINETRLRPLECPDQRLLAFKLDVQPPAIIREFRDRFGNSAHTVEVREPHRELVITAHSIVERTDISAGHSAYITFKDYLHKDDQRTHEFGDLLGPTRYIPFTPRLRRCFWSAHPSMEEDIKTYVDRTISFVRDQFGYDRGTTHVHSTVDDILTSGGGVCQDFAHLTLGLLRLAGIPARYVSGYLAPRRKGVEGPPPELASHAWVEVLLPGLGWTGYDPTHRCRTDKHYIRIAIGRDYRDVPPVSGSYKTTGGNQKMRFALRLREVAEGEQLSL